MLDNATIAWYDNNVLFLMRVQDSHFPDWQNSRIFPGFFIILNVFLSSFELQSATLKYFISTKIDIFYNASKQ